MRASIGASVVLLACVFAVIQVASMSVYGDLARRPALARRFPPAWGLRLARRLGSPQAPAVLRIAAARALLHRGDALGAAPIIAGLPAGIEAAELRGELAERGGDLRLALTEFAQAGDLERAQRLIDDRVNAGELVAAERDERALVEALGGRAADAVRARALWRLGQITQIHAVASPGQRDALEHAALGLYVQALTIAPNEETYLLAAGEQALTMGDHAAATRYYLRALDVVPDSAAAQAGLEAARS